MKIFLDANVLFTAAHFPNGKSNFLIKNSKALKLSLITSDYALEEANRNLTKKYPKALAEFIKLTSLLDVLPSVVGPCPIGLPEKDQPIYLTCLKNKATHLITGDLKDFGPFMNSPNKTHGILIQTIGEFLDSVRR